MNRMNERPQIESPLELTPETAQTAVWKSDFGREYTDRNTFDTAALDEPYRKNYGVSRRDINGGSLGDIAKKASFLGVGCNAGNQLLLLREMGYSNLSGLELQAYAIEFARRRLPECVDSYFPAESSPCARRNLSLQQNLYLGVRVLRAQGDRG